MFILLVVANIVILGSCKSALLIQAVYSTVKLAFQQPNNMIFYLLSFNIYDLCLRSVFVSIFRNQAAAYHSKHDELRTAKCSKICFPNFKIVFHYKFNLLSYKIVHNIFFVTYKIIKYITPNIGQLF